MSSNYKNKFKEELFICQTNGKISESIVQNWTIQALDCYKLKSDCKKCPIAKAKYSFKCQMKKIIKVLLKTKGLPNEKAILGIIQSDENNVA